MKALVRKDLYIMLNQMKFFLVVILIFGALLSGPFYSTFAIVYASMLPLTVLGFDEASKWDALAAMMPIRPRQLVASKYIVGYLAFFLQLPLSSCPQYCGLRYWILGSYFQIASTKSCFQPVLLHS